MRTLGGMRSRQGKRLGLLLVCLLAGSACGTVTPAYEGERLTRSQVAVVRGQGGGGPLGGGGGGVEARIEAVDGEALEGGSTSLELLPGRYEFVISCAVKGRSRRVTTHAELAAGASYVIAIGLDGGGEPDALILPLEP